MNNFFSNILGLAWLVLVTAFLICADVFVVVRNHIHDSREMWAQQDRPTGSYGNKGRW